MKSGLFVEKYQKPLSQIPSKTLKDFIGWQLLYGDDIDVSEDDISYYENVVEGEVSSMGIVIKDMAFQVEGSVSVEDKGLSIIKLMAVKLVKQLTL